MDHCKEDFEKYVKEPFKKPYHWIREYQMAKKNESGIKQKNDYAPLPAAPPTLWPPFAFPFRPPQGALINGKKNGSLSSYEANAQITTLTLWMLSWPPLQNNDFDLQDESNKLYHSLSSFSETFFIFMAGLPN